MPITLSRKPAFPTADGDIADRDTFTTQPLGAKGVGEAGTIGATPAVANAVIDALAPFGVRHLDMPLVPQKIWTAIHSARKVSS